MSLSFAETLKKLRTERGLTQQQLADLLYVDRSSIAHWENGRRIPDAVQITRIAKILDVDIGHLMESTIKSDPTPSILVIDDENIVLKGEVSTLKELFPNSSITGFNKPSEALTYAQNNRVDLVFTDIEMGNYNGLEICKELLKINPCTNVIFLTAYADYSIDAWSTGASGFIVKPFNEESIMKQIHLLRYPMPGLATHD